LVWLYISTGYTYRFGADPSLAETMIKAVLAGFGKGEFDFIWKFRTDVIAGENTRWASETEYLLYTERFWLWID